MANKKRTRKEADTARREIWGIVLSALGIFTGICLFFGTAGVVGDYIKSVLYGLIGVFAYAMPFALIIGGIIFIAQARQKAQKGRTALIITGVALIIAVLHLTSKTVSESEAFLKYVSDAYVFGVELNKGGGAVGAIILYPLLYLTGNAGAYVFLIAGILIIILLVTRISLRETGQKVGEHVKVGINAASELIENHRQNLYTEQIDDEEEYIKPVRRRSSRALLELEEGEDISFFPAQGPLRKIKKRAKRQKNIDGVNITYYNEKDISPFDVEAQPPLKVKDLRGAKFDEPKSMPPVKPKKETLKRDAFNKDEFNDSTYSEEYNHPVTADGEKLPYVPPSVTLLNQPRSGTGRNGDPNEVGRRLIETLESFNVSAKIVNISVGPVITRYELTPAAGVRVNRITALSDDIALALAAPRVRIEAPIPGKAAVGIEVPNKDSVTVVLRDIIDSREFKAASYSTALALGKDIAGKIIVADLAKMPHLLIAGQTGSGKSVCINGLILSLAYKCTPDELQLILVDPKVVELASFSHLPHLRVPVVTDPKKAAGALAIGVKEMVDRYKLFAKVGARDLERYNELTPDGKLPKIVIIIDELADLMMVAPDSVEDSICRIAQLGRASGIHLVVATQRPSADVITGLIKANIPSRIAFAVASAIDSRIILDMGGAEKLLGRGDMMFHANGANKPIRVQGAFVGDEEVERVMRHFKQRELVPEYDEDFIKGMDEAPTESGGREMQGKDEDELLGEAIRVLMDSGQASISMIQRRLRVGYARAARLVDIMEQRGFVSGYDGSKPRKILITRSQYEQLFGEQSVENEDE